MVSTRRHPHADRLGQKYVVGDKVQIHRVDGVSVGFLLSKATPPNSNDKNNPNHKPNHNNNSKHQGNGLSKRNGGGTTVTTRHGTTTKNNHQNKDHGDSNPADTIVHENKGVVDSNSSHNNNNNNNSQNHSGAPHWIVSVENGSGEEEVISELLFGRVLEGITDSSDGSTDTITITPTTTATTAIVLNKKKNNDDDTVLSTNNNDGVQTTATTTTIGNGNGKVVVLNDKPTLKQGKGKGKSKTYKKERSNSAVSPSPSSSSSPPPSPTITNTATTTAVTTGRNKAISKSCTSINNHHTSHKNNNSSASMMMIADWERKRPIPKPRKLDGTNFHTVMEFHFLTGSLFMYRGPKRRRVEYTFRI